MKVKSPRSSVPKREKNKSRKLFFILGILLIILFTCVATFIITVKIVIPAPDYLKKWALEHGHNALKNDVRLRQAYIQFPLRLLQSLKPNELPKLNIDIKFKHLTKLRDKRAEALAKGILIKGPDDFVPASIRTGGRTIKVKLRLKGDWTEHLEGKKWSFRVRVKGKDQIFGMRRFSIQKPEMRGYQGEPLFQETLRNLDVLVPRYFFVNVVINGDDIGIMALEEHFSKELLESYGRRENVIVRFDESLVWAAKDGGTFRGRKVGFGGAFDNYFNASIDAFQSSKIEKSEHLSTQYANAVGMLRGFINGNMKASEIFDAELFGKYIGVAEFWGAKHALKWHNLRFYLNPISLRMEPICFDADLRAMYNKNVIISQREPIVASILKDPKIFKVYCETIQVLAKEILNTKSFQEKLKKIEEKHLSDLRKEFYMLEKYPYHKLKSRAQYLLAMTKNDFKERIENESKKYKKSVESLPTLIHAYKIKDENGSYLELVNAIPYDVVVESVNWIGKGNKPNIEFQASSKQSFPIHLPPTSIGSLPKTQRIYYIPPSNAELYSLEVRTVIKGKKRLYINIAKPYFAALKHNPIPDSSLTEQLHQHPFMTYKQDDNCLVVQRGNWQVAGSLIVPSGITLKIPAGTVLRFSSDEGLFSRGPLNFYGTHDDPIILEGICREGRKRPWQGVAVLNANSPSVLSHVIVRNTSGISRSGWQLTGGVTFYKSDIRINESRFRGNLGEDALNIIHAKFELHRVEILETTSDGFDADFADGVVKEGNFQDIGKAGGGDAIDISGSTVVVTNSHFLNIRDKALSVGEQSKMKANKVFIEDVGTGAASKDGSSLEIIDSSIKDAYNAGLMAYIKKKEFGPARIEAKKLVFLGTESEARVQKSSSITLNGKQMETQDVDVESLYKTIMKPGLRK